MELLGMVPAEAIALRLYSLPAAAAAAGSLCAWLVAALAAAAVGLWRIRAVSAASNTKRFAGGVRSVSALVDDDNQEPQAPLSSHSQSAIDELRRLESPAEPSSMSEPSTPSKVRFTAYYGGSGDDDDDGAVDGVRKCADVADDDDDDDDGARGGRDSDSDSEVDVVLRRTVSEPGRRRATSLGTAPWEEEREMAVRRMSDLGWYRHIDMAALDGSVVRLWDGDLTLTASPRGRRRRAGLEWQLSL